MATAVQINPTSPPALGELLRHWRALRGKSQLDLALDTGISQKHVSFVETGRSTPSRQMVIDLSDALGVPLRDRNAIMLAAGYAPLYRQEAPAAMSAAIDRALQRMLRQQEPFPALVLDRHWNVLATNEAAPRFFGRFVDLDRRPRPRNLLHLVFDPEGLRPFLLDFEVTAHSLLSRVRREALGGVLDEGSRQLLAELAAYRVIDDIPSEPPKAQDPEILPVIPLRFRAGGEVISMFSLITTVGTPQTIAAEEVRLESMFPSDEASEAAYLQFMNERTNTGILRS